MGRIIAIILAIAAIPWIIVTWWRMRRARSVRERSAIGRWSIATTMLVVVGAVVFAMLSVRGQVAAIPLLAGCILAMRHGWKKSVARIRAEESDPVSKARPLN